MANQTKVKICGITNLEDARFASGAMVDYLGFIFVESSPRYIDPEKAGAIVNWVEGPEKVGVFMDQPLDDVNVLAKFSGIDLVQLHGNETLEYCQLIEKPIIKVIHVGETSSKEEIETQVALYSEVAEFLLFDTKANGKFGGTGKTFDWSLLNEIADDIPFFLAGGLNPENVSGAIEMVQPFAVDLNSGVEEEPGLKDFEKIEQLMENLKSYII
ncbi:MAG: phosphoribosylanthranilate isomerase [Balneolaceae bacterium]|nr:phosphoribosylanthranilate isomerase [Balneolaceae bacterium]